MSRKKRKPLSYVDSATWGVLKRGGLVFVVTATVVTVVTIAAVAVMPLLGLSVWTVLGSSMEPTLSDGDMIVLRASQGGVKAGEIVVVSKPESWYRVGKDLSSHRDVLVKRVAAVPGDTVTFTNGNLDVNGNTVYSIRGENYPCHAVQDGYKHTLNNSEIMILGDNPLFSLDSRKIMCTTGVDGMYANPNRIKTHGSVIAHT